MTLALFLSGIFVGSLGILFAFFTAVKWRGEDTAFRTIGIAFSLACAFSAGTSLATAIA